ncbi:MAG: hypothetical protein WAZ34_12600 [Rhodocyclaceae bacterium]
MFDQQSANFCQLMAPETLGHREVNRVQPIFCRLVSMLDMDVRRFRSFSTEEEKPESRHNEHCRHEQSLAASVFPAKNTAIPAEKKRVALATRL